VSSATRLPLPGARAVVLLGAAALGALGLLVAGVAMHTVAVITAAAAAALLVALCTDLWRARRAWQAHPLVLRRRLPAALALGVPREAVLELDNPGPTPWRVRLHDHPDERLAHEGLPLALHCPPMQRLQARYRLHPHERGAMRFAPAELRLSTPWGLAELRRRVGAEETLRVYPDFAQVARYAWLAGDRRLAEMGIKPHVQRGEGTDFKELAEYRPGDDIRHVDWKATLRFNRPIVREFQDERDQSVLFLLDCGRRMRAAEDEATGGGHFDHALNAMMLLAYVALASGDAVGAMTYGGGPQQARHFAPRKGRATLHAMMAALHDLQPGTQHADLQRAAAELMRQQPKRSLIVVLTNLRGEDADEVAPALKLLRTRHLVLLASLREAALRQATEQPLTDAAAARRVAAAHGLQQARHDALARLTARDALVLDCEPAQLPAALVNRYHAVKQARLL
jgi:uncharacterized protein (DUF58 family)